MRRQRPWLLWLALALLVLLGAMAVLQYRWVGEVSQAGRHRLATTLQGRAQQFTDEFDREIARAFFWLQVEPTSLQGDNWTRYAERYERWLAGAAHPRLVREIWLFVPGQAPRRFSLPDRSFVEAPLPASLAALASETQKPGGPLAGAREGGSPWLHAIREEIPAIVVPVPQIVAFRSEGDVHIEHLKTPSLRAYTAILIDEPYLARELLPGLASRAFGPSDSSDYHVTIRSRAGNREVFSYGPPVQGSPGKPDIALPLLDVRLEAIADMRAAALGGRESGKPAAFPPRFVLDRRSTGDAPPESLRFRLSVIQRKDPGAPAGAIALAAPKWQLEVRHRAGSLEAAVASARRRNLALSGGVLLLFASSIGLLVVSAQRASRLAAQQIEFVAAVSHELRTPLAVIRSAGENLADGLVQEQAQVKRYGELVRNEGLRLSAIVEQVLAFAGMRGDARLRLRPAQVSAVIQQGIDGASVELKESGLALEVVVPAGLPAVRLDGDAVARALTNLLTNAAKYAREGGWVRVEAQASSGSRRRELRLSVTDSGPGISPGDLPHVFEPFYRATSVLGSPIPGTGLGLSLVRAIARAHGGRVTVEPGVERGCVFTLHLPLLEADATAPAGEPVAASRS